MPRAAKSPRPEPTPVERALRLLAFRARTEHELDQALARAKVTPADRAAALARMRELGYIDDPSLAQARARQRLSKGDAPRMIAQRLLQQGVAAEEAHAAAKQATAGASEDELAVQALARRLRGRPVKDEKERRRLLRALMQHGHRASSAVKALRLAMDGAEVESAEVDADVDVE